MPSATTWGAIVAIARELPDIIGSLNDLFGRGTGKGTQKKAQAISQLQTKEASAGIPETPEVLAARDVMIEAQLAYLKAAEAAGAQVGTAQGPTAQGDGAS